MKKKNLSKSHIKISVLLITVVFSSLILLTACQSAGVQFAVNDNVYKKARSYSEILDTVERTIPAVTDGGLDYYPTYTNILTDPTQIAQVAAENKSIHDFATLDIDGVMSGAVDQSNNGKKMTKHSAADSSYNGYIPDDAAAVAKKLYINPYTEAMNLTGLYAGAGEVITVVLPDYVVAAGGVRISIGSLFHVDNKAKYDEVGYNYNNIPTTGAEYNRMPNMAKTFDLTEKVNYIGNPLGGPLSVAVLGDTKNKPCNITIIGAMESPDYILGATSEAEWDKLIKDAPGLYVNVQAGDYRMSMPKSEVIGISGESMRLSAEFWSKAIKLSGDMSPQTNDQYGDVGINHMLFDQYSEKNEAYAYLGQYHSVAPVSWARGALNYDLIIKDGNWGNLHQMNYQHMGFGPETNSSVSEVINDAITAATYILHTNIAAGRSENGGLSGSNWVTDYAASLNKLTGSMGSANAGLSMHATLMHAFGVDAYIKVAPYTTEDNISRDMTAAENFYMQFSLINGVDLTYFFEELCGFTLSDKVKSAVKAKDFKQFVPIATVYQAEHDGIATGREFLIPAGQNKEFNFNAVDAAENAGYTASPSPFKFEIVRVSAPLHGELVESAIKGIYNYTPKSEQKSDEFEVTFKFTNAPFEVENTTVKIKLKQDSNGLSVDEWMGIDSQSIDNAIVQAQSQTPNKEYNVNSSYIDNSAENSLIKVDGKIIAPYTGTYTFMIRGDEQAVLKMGASIGDLLSVARFDEYTSSYDINKLESKYEVKLNAGDVIYFELWTINKTGRGGVGLGWIDRTPSSDIPQPSLSDTAMTGEVIDIPNSVIYNVNTDTTISERYLTDYNDNNGMSESQQITAKSNIKVKSAPAAYQTDYADNMFDKYDDTVYKSKHRSISTDEPTDATIPLEIAFAFDSQETFNQIKITNSIYEKGSMNSYKVLVGNDMINMTQVSEGNAPKTNKFNINFKTVTANYIKILIYSVHSDDYISIADIKIGNGFETTTFISHEGSDLQYYGEWQQDASGYFVNGAIMQTNDGTMEFAFSGTGVALYSKVGYEYGKGQIRIDDGEWFTFDQYSEQAEYGKMVFSVSDLEQGIHTVEIKNNEDSMINIDYFGFKPTIPIPEEPMAAVWIVFIVIAAIIAAAGIGVGAYFATDWYMKRKNAPLGNTTKTKKSNKGNVINNSRDERIEAQDFTAETQGYKALSRLKNNTNNDDISDNITKNVTPKKDNSLKAKAEKLVKDNIEKLADKKAAKSTAKGKQNSDEDQQVYFAPEDAESEKPKATPKTSTTPKTPAKPKTSAKPKAEQAGKENKE